MKSREFRGLFCVLANSGSWLLKYKFLKGFQALALYLNINHVFLFLLIIAKIIQFNGIYNEKGFDHLFLLCLDFSVRMNVFGKDADVDLIL